MPCKCADQLAEGVRAVFDAWVACSGNLREPGFKFGAYGAYRDMLIRLSDEDYAACCAATFSHIQCQLAANS